MVIGDIKGIWKLHHKIYGTRFKCKCIKCGAIKIVCSVLKWDKQDSEGCRRCDQTRDAPHIGKKKGVATVINWDKNMHPIVQCECGESYKVTRHSYKKKKFEKCKCKTEGSPGFNWDEIERRILKANKERKRRYGTRVEVRKGAEQYEC